ncbi:hypothetical protein SuNHUV7_30920 (plasmid) [Pseudoseohaeicola sp. NH-UV-7]
MALSMIPGDTGLNHRSNNVTPLGYSMPQLPHSVRTFKPPKRSASFKASAGPRLWTYKRAAASTAASTMSRHWRKTGL